MKKWFLFPLLILLLISCGSKDPKILSSSPNPVSKSTEYIPFFDVKDYAPKSDYGLSEKNPVKVGGVMEQEGPINQRRYLSSLAGPNGEVLSFHRRGSCCPYASNNAFGSRALLDVYEVTYEGLDKPILIYISLYDYETLYIPKGFKKAR
jgi:hypothetical protein